MESALQRVPTWTWVAQDRDGTLLGLVQGQPLAAASWITPAVDAPTDRVACLGLLFVCPDQRARGVGTRLVASAHHALDEQGIAVTLLHHSLPNPFSTPFWARQGYRPLWTAWQRRPAWRTGPE